jgi:hypothetical protein
MDAHGFVGIFRFGAQRNPARRCIRATNDTADPTGHRSHLDRRALDSTLIPAAAPNDLLKKDR